MTTITYKDFALEVETLSADATLYLLTYGLKQSLQDCIAGMAKKLGEEGHDASSVEMELNAAQAKRFNDILEGTINVRTSGPRLKGLEKVMAEVAEEKLMAAFGKAGKKWPQGKGSAETIGKLRDAYLAKFHDVTEKEAKRRMTALEAQGDDLDLEALLG